jgi:hypothetical protein
VKNTKHQIIEEYKPKIWDKVSNAIRQSSKGLLEMSQGTLMGMLLACTLLPLAVSGTEQAVIAISTILGGIGGNLVANWVQRFYDIEINSDQNRRNELIGELETNAELRSAIKELFKEFDVIKALQNSTDISREELLKKLEGSWLQEIVGDDNIQISSGSITTNQSIKGSRNIQITGDGVVIESETLSIKTTKPSKQE